MKSPCLYSSTGLMLLFFLALSSGAVRTASAFSVVHPQTLSSLLSSSLSSPTPTSLVVLQAAGGSGGGGKKKGFGNAPPIPEPKKKKKPDAADTSTTTTNNNTPSSSSSTSTSTSTTTAAAAAATSNGGSSKAAAAAAASTSTSASRQNPGQIALEDMRRVRAEEKDAELRKVRDLVQTDAAIKEAPAVIPERVAQRMGKRMLPFVGVPFVGGITAFTAFYYYAVVKNMEFQPVLVAGSTIGILVFSLLGITYSVMSASWDPDREGDLLGTEEFSRNLDNIREGLGRSRENALLRDKMESLSGEELQRAMDDLERKEAAEAKRMSMKSQTLTSRLKDELD